MSDPSSELDHLDDGVDDEIAACLDLNAPRSFFLFAGAGSGKTRSLVHAINYIRKTSGEVLRLKGQKVAVITYTNAACDEIKRRTAFDPVIEVSTIHSFAWTVLQSFTPDIKTWLRDHLESEIAELEMLEAKGRKGTKASASRIAQMASKRNRLVNLKNVRKFIYSPTSNIRGRDALSHSEVIRAISDLVQQKAVLQKIVVGSYPVVLVDESQDTSKHLIDALFSLQAANRNCFSLGLLGDMMQRIYSDGKDGLGVGLPDDWATPVKRLNHRSPKRVVKLINEIRREVDGQEQVPVSRSAEGHVRLFVLPDTTADKPGAEAAIAAQMGEVTQDTAWANPTGVKQLILEHRMAARRLGFLDMFAPLYEIDDFRTGLLDGTLSVLRMFSEQVLPLLKAKDNRFAIAKIMRTESPLLDVPVNADTYMSARVLREANEATHSLFRLWDKIEPTFGEVLQNVFRSTLFVVPDILLGAAAIGEARFIDLGNVEPDEADELPAKAAALEAFLETQFSQIEQYSSYVKGVAQFATHQGVKGLEFPRVMAIMDDSEARGFQFKYEKLFTPSVADDATTRSTRRLLYVTCSRAERSLVVVMYSSNPQQVRDRAIAQNWFAASEVQIGL